MMNVHVHWTEDGYQKGVNINLPPEVTEVFMKKFVKSLRDGGFDVRVWAQQTVEVYKEVVTP